MHKIYRLKKYLWLLVPMLPLSAHAHVTLGKMADNVLGPAAYLVEIIFAIFLAVGGALLFSSFLQYRTHRKNPTQIPFSRVVTTFIFGFALVLLPLISFLASEEPPASTQKKGKSHENTRQQR